MTVKITDECDWTVAFQFPNPEDQTAITYPSNDQKEMWTSDVSKAKVFESKDAAEEFGRQHGGKWGWTAVALTMTIIHQDDIIRK